MSSLANTTWNLTQDGEPGLITTVAFGPADAPPGRSGGFGTMTNSDGQTPMVWVESGSSFMIQLQDQDPGYATLTTYAGTHAEGAGSGWSSNFTIGFSASGFSLTRKA